MSNTTPQETLDTNASEVRRNRLEAVWLAWHPGEPMPRWQDHLPADEEPRHPELIFDLLQMDIEFRVKAGLPALLAEPYFAHPRLQRDDARLNADWQVALIRWEYQQRWQQRDPARRAEYEAAFPQHADAVRDLKPSSRCPRCQKHIVLEETMQTLACPACGNESAIRGGVPPFVAETSPVVRTAPAELDPRRYELLETLGAGGMGAVYRCGDPALGRDLATKVIRAEFHNHPQIEGRFVREACITASLQHPNIVAVHNLGPPPDGRLHYTMRLVRGQTFAAILNEQAAQREGVPDPLIVFEKICQAVAYAHSKRVIHRDLKPSNVMVGHFGEVRVMDWGLAKKLAATEGTAAPDELSDGMGTVIHTEPADTPVDATRPWSRLGTPEYMSPEHAASDWAVVDERADVFALGSIPCEMLTGQPAYSGGGDEDERIRRARCADLTEGLARLELCAADAPLKVLCRACLSPNREDRPRNAGFVAERVEAYQREVQERLRQAELERVAAEARAKGETERAREALARVQAERRAKRRTLALAAAAMVVIVGGGGALWWKHLKQNQADREALAVLERGRARLDEGWRTNDVPKLSERWHLVWRQSLSSRRL